VERRITDECTAATKHVRQLCTIGARSQARQQQRVDNSAPTTARRPGAPAARIDWSASLERIGWSIC
jgi:hypothetical protein